MWVLLFKKKRKHGRKLDFKVTKFSDITEIIIPFFINNPILGIKSIAFSDGLMLSMLRQEIVKKREHKQEENILKIKEIQKGMNRGRSF